MRFTILAAPGSDPGDARPRASAVVTAGDPAAVAAAARAAADRYVLLLAPGARPLPGAFGGLSTALGERTGVLGGAAHAGGARSFGWMLAPAPWSPLPFELVPLAAQAGEPGADALVRGPVDVVAPGMILADRALLAEPLPEDPVAAAVELCARARAAGLDVVCRPSFAFDAVPPDRDDRGRAAALRAVAERRPELTGAHRLPPAARGSAIEREVRLGGGGRVRARLPFPPLTVLVHGAGAELAARRARDLAPAATARAVDDPAAALRAEMRLRTDRYVLLASAGELPGAAEFAALVEAIESDPFVALAAPDAAALFGGCVLVAPARFPAHIEAAGTSAAAAVASLVDAAAALRRAVRAPGFTAAVAPPAAPRSAGIVFLASSTPELLRMTLGAVVESSRAGDEIVAVCAASAQTTRRAVEAYPQIRVEADEVDPLLAAAANRAIGAVRGELVVLVADDVLLPAGALDRVRDAFARVPALGAAFPAVPGAPGGEAAFAVQYADIGQLQTLAAERARTRSRATEPIDVGVTPAVAVAREAFDVVGGIDPGLGPTRRGIAELITRIRAAGYVVVRCDDALVHRFDAATSQSVLAAADARSAAPAADPAAIAAGFDPARRVPFAPAAGGGRADAVHAGTSHAIAVPVGGAAELERAAVFVAAAARAFDATSPVRVHVLLDGSVGAGDAAALLRPVLAAGGRPIDAALAVRVERVTDLAAWRAALEPGVRALVAAGHERPALAGLAAVAPQALPDLLRAVSP